MEFLRRRLDDGEAAPCGRCDNCAGTRFDPAVEPGLLEAARGELSRPGTPVEPRRMRPTGLPAVGVDLRGRIPPGEQASAGRALGRLSDIGWGNRLRALLGPRAADAPVPQDVLDAVVAVLADWARGPDGWASGEQSAPRRPGGVVTIASRTRPQLVGSLGEGIAAVGRMPLLGAVEPAWSEASAGGSNSARRVRALHGSLRLPPAVEKAVRATPGPLLLVDDATETGWTLAVAARLLRRAGSGDVLPLVLAVRG